MGRVLCKDADTRTCIRLIVDISVYRTCLSFERIRVRDSLLIPFSYLLYVLLIDNISFN